MTKSEIARNDATWDGPATVEPIAVGTHLRLAAISILGQLRDNAGAVLVTGQPIARAALAAYLAELLEQETAGEIIHFASHPNSTPEDVLRHCCAELGVAADGDAGLMQGALAERLAATRRKGVDTLLWLGNVDALPAPRLCDIHRRLQAADILRLPVILAASADFDGRFDATELLELKQALRARYRLPPLDAASPGRGDGPRGEARIHKTASASEANAVLMNILQAAGQRAKSDGLLHYPGPAAANAAPDAKTAEDRPREPGAAPLLLEHAAAVPAPAPARKGRRFGAFALAGIGYVAIVGVVGLVVLQTLPLGVFGLDHPRPEPRAAVRDAAAALLPPRAPEAARPAPADDEAASAPTIQTAAAPESDSAPVPASVPAGDAPAASGSLLATPESAEASPPAALPPIPAAAEPAVPTAAEPAAPTAAESPVPVAAEPVANLAVSSSPSPTPPQAEIDLLMRRGRALLDVGDVVAARLFLEPLASGGYAPAATLLGETHDPLYLGKLGARGIRPDPARAAAWYRKASADGDAEAADRLSRLLARFPQ